MIPFSDLLIALQWLVVLMVCSILGTMIFMRAGNLAAISYAFGKVAGLVGLAALTWILSLIKAIPFKTLWIWLLVAVLFMVVIRWRHKAIKKALSEHWRTFLYIEIIFVLLFVVGLVIRSSIPKIEGIEKPMDAAILSNLLRHSIGVPIDTWYAPDSINYYYFGHWIIAMLAKMSHVGVAHAFNLGFATVLAISGTSIFVLTWQITKHKVAGWLGLFLALFASNLHPFIQVLSSKADYLFFNSGRFIEQVINEYPLYSLILGDLHAHMMALMLSTGFYILMVWIYLDKSNFKSLITKAAIGGGLVGLLSATNSFDVISCSLIFALTLVFMRYRQKIDSYQMVWMAVVYGLVFVAITLIFMTHFLPAVGGVAVALFKTPFKHVFWQFGLPVVIGGAAWVVLKQKDWLKKFNNRDLAVIFGLGGLGLILLPQLIFVKDIYYFQNPPFARANTVFKLWYAAWPLVAIAAASLITALDCSIKRKFWCGVWGVMVLMACVILSFGLHYGLRTLNDSQSSTLNGLSFINYKDPAKLKLLEWVDKNISGQPLALQAPGDSYTSGSWLSSYSGLPTIIGWQSHEWGWRYDENEWGRISTRVAEIEALYQSATTDELLAKAKQLNVGYILIGPEELTTYSINRQVFDQALGQPIYGNSRYVLYGVTN